MVARSLLFVIFFSLGACSSLPRQSALSASVITNPSGDFWVIVGSEQGLSTSKQSAQHLNEAWSTVARAACGGSFEGTPDLQVTSFALPGQPFADPRAHSPYVKFTAALGSAQCTDLLASTAGNFW